MESMTQIDEVSDLVYHEQATGKAFAVDNRNKLAVFGGRRATTIVDLLDTKTVLKQVPLKAPLKWDVTNYDWDPTINFREGLRYLQTRNKVIEVVNLYNTDSPITLSGHRREVSDAKWSIHKRNLIASTSADQSILVWNTEMAKPTISITSLGDPSCLAWHKHKENLLAVACNNDIRIYDIRKTSAAYKYITNAHSKKIYSLDWCSSEEILLSSSRDGTIKLWNPNMIHQKFMQIRLDFPNWKAKFTPYGLCLAVIPTSSSPYGMMPSPPSSNYAKLNLFNHPAGNGLLPSHSSFGKNGGESYLDAAMPQIAPPQLPATNLNSNMNMYNTSMLICQVTSLHQAKIFNYVSCVMNTILDFDFYLQEDKCSVVTWTSNQYLGVCNLELQQFASERAPSSQAYKNREDDENLGKAAPANQVSLHQSLAAQIQPNTSNSSRKSSVSELYGTPPTNNASLSIVSSRTIVNERDSITQSDDHTSINTTDTKTIASSMTNPINLLKSSSGGLFVTFEPSSPVMKNVEKFIIPYPRVFAAKFNGLPQHMLVFRNEDFTYNPSKHGKEFSVSSLRHAKRNHSKNKMQMGQKQALNFHILDVSRLVNVNRALADSYWINGLSLEKVCDHNIAVASLNKRQDVAKIWEMLKFITLSNSDSISLNPHDGRPWSSSVFGRPLANYLIDTCIKANDLQTAVMIIAMLKQHDMKLIPNASSVERAVHVKKANKMSELFTLYDSSNNSFSEPIDLECPKRINYESSLLPSFAGLKDNLTPYELHYYNIGLLDPVRIGEFDTLIKYYCDLLYRWKIYIKRVELLEIVSEKSVDYEEKFQCATRCVVCSSPSKNEKCDNCKTYLVYCSLCQFPVHGLSTYCVVCGHGGHYDHMIEWFKKHDDCPCACGCRCVDYS